MGAARSVWAGWGWEEAQMRVSGQRARDLEPLGTQAGPDAGFIGLGAGDLSLDLSPTR